MGECYKCGWTVSQGTNLQTHLVNCTAKPDYKLRDTNKSVRADIAAMRADITAMRTDIASLTQAINRLADRLAATPQS